MKYPATITIKSVNYKYASVKKTTQASSSQKWY